MERVRNYYVPNVVENTPRGERGMDLYSRLLREHIIILGTPIDDTIANLVCAQLLYLQYENADRDINLYINNRFVKLLSIATVERTYVDPPQKIFRVGNRQAIGIGIAMRPGANVLEFGENLRAVAEQLEQRFPIGIEVRQVSDQPAVVEESIHGFTKALWEAIAIVLAVSFLSLGFRAGIVVATSIPLVLAIVFLCMEIAGISLQRISLGALIIALGLLVDDAMITVEMMVAQIEAGVEKTKAAVYAYTHTAFPMLTGTLVTIAGFVPVGFAKSGTGQYCYSLFAVVALALVVSWFVAVLIAGAAIDVFDQEPLPPNHPFRTMTNVLATPHIGYVSRGLYETFYRDTVANIRRWLEESPT